MMDQILTILQRYNYGESDSEILNKYCLSFIDSGRNETIIQKMASKYKIEELKLLHKKFKENNIIYVVLKGYPLAADVYPYPESRPFGDIDLMVAPEDLEKALTLCVSLGFSNEDIETNGVHEEIKQYLKRGGSHHYKKIWKQSGFIKISVELHIDCICKPMLNLNNKVKDFNQAALQNRRMLHLENLDVYVMDPLDIFISLSMHMLRHFTYDSLFSFNFYIYDKKYIDLKNLVDVHYLLIKYHIHLEDVLQYSEQFGLYMETLIVIRCLTTFFQDYNGIFSINESKLRLNGFHNQACKFVLLNGVHYLLIDCFSFANTVIKSCINDTPSKIIICKNIQCRKKFGLEDYIHINGFNYLSDTNKFSFIERKPSGKFDCDCILDCYYDEQFLYFRIKVIDDELIIQGGTIEPPIDDYFDIFKIHFIDPNHSHVDQYIAIRFGIYQQQDPYIYLQNFNGAISKNQYHYKLHYNESGYELEIALKYELFGEKVENGFRIEFIINDVDIKPPLFRCVNRWSSSLLHGLHDPTTYAKLLFDLDTLQI